MKISSPFFEKLGIQLKEEDHGRMFPVTDKAQSVVDALLNRLKQLNVTIRTNEKIKEVRYENGRTAGITTNNDEHINADAVIIAVGGKSVPHTGNTGDGYAWAEAAGHTVTELFPTEVPVTSSEPFIKQKTLQGLSLRNAAVSVLNKKRQTNRHTRDGHAVYPFRLVRPRHSPAATSLSSKN